MASSTIFRENSHNKIYIYIYVYIHLIIQENQETNDNINVKVNFKTNFQLKCISPIYSHGYITQSWRYNTG